MGGPGKSQIPWKLIGRKWAIDTLRAIATFTLVFVFHLFISDRPLGEYVRNFEHAILQQTLISNFSARDAVNPDERQLPVVINIAKFRLDRQAATDREQLQKLVAFLHSAGAAVIGIDVDFSPEDDGRFVTPLDPRLFDTWKQFGNVRVGVFRRQGYPADMWLGRREFQDLAAGMALPLDRPQYAFYWSAPYPLTEDANNLLQMPAALHAFLHPDAPGRIFHDASRTTFVADGKVHFGAFAIDYSVLDRVKLLEPDKLSKSGSEVTRRVVLLGDVEDLEDARCISYRRKPISGVLIHACAYATLARGLLWEITEWQSFWADIVFIVGAIFVMGARELAAHTYLRRLVARCTAAGLDHHEIEVLYCAVLAMAILTVNWLLTNISRLFWPDAYWIAAAVLLHPYIADVFGVCWAVPRVFVPAAQKEATLHAD